MATAKKEATVSLKVNPNLKRLAEETLKKLGLNTHAAVNLMLKQMAIRGEVPFEVSLAHPEQNIITDELSVYLMVKVPEDIKEQCVKLSQSAGLNFSAVINMFLVQVVDKQGIPFKIISGGKANE